MLSWMQVTSQRGRMSVQWRERDWESLRREVGVDAWIRRHLALGRFTVIFLLCTDQYPGATARLHSVDVAARSTVFFGAWERSVDYRRY
jgi:hypothetical protein